MNVPPLERRKPDLSLASSKEVDNGVSTAVVFCEPLLADHGIETGTETSREAGEPKTVDRDRETGGFEGDGRIGHVWVATVQQLVRE